MRIAKDSEYVSYLKDSKNFAFFVAGSAAMTWRDLLLLAPIGIVAEILVQ